MHRKMHILDVISSVSRSSKCTKIVGGWGLSSDPSRGTYNTLPDPLARFKEPISKVPTSKGRGGDMMAGERKEERGGEEGRQSDSCPRAPETFAPPLIVL